MINKTQIWNHGVEAMEAFVPFYRPQAAESLREARANQAWLPLLRTAGVYPNPLTPSRLAALTPYIAAQRRSEMLDSALRNGLLSANGSGRYHLTERGTRTLTSFFDHAHQAIAQAPVLPEDEMEELAGLLRRIVNAACDLPLPREKSNLESSRWTDPGPDAPAAVRVDQYLTDLTFFRGDAHVASWQSYGIDGRSWEAFTYIWRDKANTPAELAARLVQRGYDEEDYARAVQLLLEKGWIEQAVGRWQVTGSGKALRDVAEMVTNRLFFAAWRALSEEELDRLNGRLICLTRSLKKAAPVSLPA